jgi:hypothetical protein|tara:strand:- start:630 stop:962 length:333 start_codon:yes stop_codon:yes gene_type:complete
MKTLMYNQNTKDVKLTGMKLNSPSGDYEKMVEGGYEPIAHMVGVNVTLQPIKKIERTTSTEQLLDKALNLIISLESSGDLSTEMKQSVDALFNEIKYSDRLDDEMEMYSI